MDAASKNVLDMFDHGPASKNVLDMNGNYMSRVSTKYLISVVSRIFLYLKVWRRLLPNMALGCMIRNLSKMTELEIFDDQENVNRVTSALRDPEILKRARIHPLSVRCFLIFYLHLIFYYLMHCLTSTPLPTPSHTGSEMLNLRVHDGVLKRQLTLSGSLLRN